MISRKLDTALLLAFLLVQLFSVLFVHVITMKGSPDGDNPEHIHLTYQGDPASTVTVTWQTGTPTISAMVLYDTVARSGTPSLYRYSAPGSSHTYEG
ncbi:MAG: fibronectin type III domain-containing protein, partial [Candidatus Heimdallarchaeota archaeon]